MNQSPENHRAVPKWAEEIAQWLARLGERLHALQRLQIPSNLKPQVYSLSGLRAVPAMAYAQVKGIPYRSHSGYTSYTDYTGNRAQPVVVRWTIKR